MSKFRTLTSTAWLGMIATSLLASCASKDSSSNAASNKDAGPPSLGQQQTAMARPEPTHDVLRDVRARFRLREPDEHHAGPSRASNATFPLLRWSQVERFESTGGRLDARIPENLLKRRKHVARVELPATAAAPFRVTDQTTGLWVEIATIGVTDVKAEVADGFVVYRGAMDKALGTNGSGHVIHRVTATGTEDYVTIDTPPAAPELSYRVQLGDSVRGLRVVENNVEFVDYDNGPRLRMAPPFLLDAKGKRHDATAAVTDCKFDSDPSAPWGRRPVAPGSRFCTIKLSWADATPEYPAVLDPAWTAAGDMSTVRRFHTMTTVIRSTIGELVLAAGGESDTALLASSELFNPKTLTWAATGSLVSPKVNHTATAVSGADDAKVLAAGGAYSSTTVSQSARLYDPVAGTWAAAANMNAKRAYHSALRLANSTIMLAAGSSTYPAITPIGTAEIYNPATNTWSDSGDMLNKARAKAMLMPASNTLSQTELVLAGGTTTDSDELADAERYVGIPGNPGTWTTSGVDPLPAGMKAALVFGSSTELAVAGSAKNAFKYSAGHWTNLGSTVNSYLYPAGALFGNIGPQFLLVGANAEVYRSGTGGGFMAIPNPGDIHMRGAADKLNGGFIVVSGGQSVLDGWTAATNVYQGVAQGGTCTHNGECSSKYCVDGVCCNTACTSACYACSAAKKGQGSNGVCDVIISGQDPDNDCPDDGAPSCDRDGTCNGAGACKLYANMTQCADSVCSAGSITNFRCNGSGDCLSAMVSCSPYQCSSVTSCGVACVTDANCLTDYYCATGVKKCLPKKPQGNTCTANGECMSNFCADGVCCNEACTGLCKGCTAAIKGSGGGADGECGFVVSGRDTQDECSQDPQSSCGKDGTCNGAGACKLWSNVSCGSTWCDANTLKGQRCDGSGNCVNDGTTGTPCSPYLCVGSSCTSPCVADSSCINNNWCDNGVCREKLANGQPCQASSQCANGNCVDNYCCNSACSGLCYSCSAAKKHQGINGECGPVVTGYDDDNDCAVGSECKEDGTCNGSGACRMQVSGTSCGSSVCVGNAVAEQMCNGLGTCVNKTSGSECAPYLCSSGACTSPCAADSHCANGYFCDNGACTARFPTGTVCTAGSQCTSGNCIDGFCCDTSCASLCNACSAAKKGNGADGVCGAIIAGTDPDEECTVGTACGQDGSCNGSGSCSLRAAGFSCGATQCVGNKVTGQVCNGTGLCINDSVGTECSPYLCSGGACTQPCLSDSHCVTGYACVGSVCVGKKANGGACTTDNECLNGNCVDGVCCNTACSGLCVACTATLKGGGLDGECGGINAGTDPSNECELEAACGKDGTCDGIGACRLKIAGTSCGASQCLGNKVTGQVCDGAGLCINNAVGTECAPYLCSGGACSTPCVSDSNCVTGYFCNAGSCQVQKAIGTACSAANECDSDYCVDGVCCDSACSSLCKACSAAKKGGGANGECGAIQAGSDPDDECSVEAGCGKDGTCNGTGLCRLKQAGVSCGSSQCVLNKVTGQVCDGNGLCINDAAGTECAPYLCSGGACSNPCVSDTNCTSGNFCINGTCQAKKSNGQSCSIGNECSTGFCTDGVCCNQECSGLCSACSAAKKGAGTNGECGSIQAGSDPDNECQVEAACGQDGTCNGLGACRLKLPGVSCGSSQCVGNTVKGQVCDGSGLCINDSVGTDCTPHLCSGGACSNPCVADANCTSGYFCSSGTCTIKKATGQACSGANQCTTGFCADGFCCNTACSGLCAACSSAKKGVGINGECGSVAAGQDPDDECAVEAGCAKDGTCNGTGACRLKVAGTSCGASQCVLNKVTGQVCDGNGLCINDAVGTNCSPFLCSGGACSNPCVSDSNCTTGYFCQSGACVAKKTPGQACSINNECGTGYCVDGVCCDSQCSGLCSACSKARKGSGLDGECGSIASGSDPDNECELEAACGKDGTCNGTGGCRLKLAGVSCGSSQCVGNTVKGQVCDGAGLCINDAVGTTCSPYQCSGGACKSPCLADTDCVNGYFCSSGSCEPKKVSGEACALGSECDTGYCADGVCCNSQCTGLCSACSSAKKGIGADGECGPIQAGSDPENECELEAACGKDGTCDGIGGCRLKQPGVSCGASQCLQNKVTGQQCNGNGACVNNSTGTDCGNYLCENGTCNNPCIIDAHCLPGNFCNQGSCEPKLLVGAACTLANQCALGFCSDGVCCDKACSSPCEACSADKKESGINGECGPAKAGTDPHSDCTKEAAATCQSDGECDGTGACRLYAEGTSCGDSYCDGNNLIPRECNGSGVCKASATTTTCSPFMCSSAQGACATGCQSHTDCVPNATTWCTPEGKCAFKEKTGTKCSDAAGCETGFCVDGYCCDTECTGQCQACDMADKEGTCTLVTGDPHGKRPKCLGAGSACEGTCNGALDNECAYQTGNECGSSCKDDNATLKQCDGKGSCEVGGSKACAPFKCDKDGIACLKTCKLDTECATGSKCEMNTGKCVEMGSTCRDDFTAQAPNGTQTDCSPYKCANGACRDTCSTTNDCASGYDCAGGKCVGTAADAGDEAGEPAATVSQNTGCGCRTASTSRSTGGLALLGLAIASLLRRRR